jgi:uncharacterized SAM-binding protein YcdF (DUF218 family)
VVPVRRLLLGMVIAILLCACQPQQGAPSLRGSDAIVLLAGNLRERAPKAAELFHGGGAPLIIITNDGVGGGWSARYGRCLTHSEWAEEELSALGVPRTSMVKLPFYRSGTIYDASAVLHYTRPRALKRIIVVTSQEHARRALWCFRRLAADGSQEISVSPARSLGHSYSEPFEILKLAYYVFNYWLLRREPRL